MGHHLDKLRGLLGEVADLSAAASVLGWDQQTYMPPKGTPARAMQLATLGRLAHEKFISDEMGEALERAGEEVAGLDSDSDDARLVLRVRREFEKQRKVPAEWVGEFARVTSLAHQVWEKARAEKDFAQFRPSLEQIVQLRRQYADFFGPYDHVYDPLLDDFERGMKTTEVMRVFGQLRPQQVELVKAIAERGRVVDDSVLHRSFDVEKQREFGLEVVKQLGYDLERGRCDTSAHPFTTGFSIDDVRITTRFDPNYLPDFFFSIIHEAGHAMYDQGFDPAFERTPLASGASYAVHESQSRMWENLVGRSRAFWQHFYPRLQQYFPASLGDVDLETFYRAINKVQPSFIRVDADEATYNLHIMLRFELEVALMSNSLAVGDLPEAWNTKMRDYLGLTPPDDAKGVLQDVHWSSGLMGYFPTYALGNLVAAQLWEKICQDIPDLEGQIRRGQFGGLLAWLREKVHRHGAKFEPAELVQRVTGQALTPGPFLRYLQGKFGEMHGLQV